MAYRIVYGGEIPAERKTGKNFRRLKVLTACFLLLFALVVRQYWPEGTQRLRMYLLPGQNPRQALLDELASDVRNGMAVDEALTVFCRNLIQNGKTG